MTVPLLEPKWAAPATVRAAFSLRSGGTSEPPWDTLNLGVHVGDDPSAVLENRRRLANALSLPSEPVWLDQVHGNDVLEVDAHSRPTPDTRPRADALVTRAAGVVLAIQVADCLPVLFSSRDGRVLGAAHAGWRGLAAGVLEATVTAMGGPSRRDRGLARAVYRPGAFRGGGRGTGGVSRESGGCGEGVLPEPAGPVAVRPARARSAAPDGSRARSGRGRVVVHGCRSGPVLLPPAGPANGANGGVDMVLEYNTSWTPSRRSSYSPHSVGCSRP